MGKPLFVLGKKQAVLSLPEVWRGSFAGIKGVLCSWTDLSVHSCWLSCLAWLGGRGGRCSMLVRNPALSPYHHLQQYCFLNFFLIEHSMPWLLSEWSSWPSSTNVLICSLSPVVGHPMKIGSNSAFPVSGHQIYSGIQLPLPSSIVITFYLIRYWFSTTKFR
jgi:hypothetical protein